MKRFLSMPSEMSMEGETLKTYLTDLEWPFSF